MGERKFQNFICPTCGKKFEKYTPPSLHYVKHFCCNQCRLGYHRVYRICQECGKQFHKAKSNIDRNSHNGTYCSKKCTLVGTGKRQSGSKNWQWVERQKFICKTCGHEFGLKPNELNTTGRGSYCSMECKHIGQSNRLRNERNPNWQGGISRLPYAPTWGYKLKEQIKERDNHQCQVCGDSKRLVVHHIDYTKLNCEPDNLITLCHACHAKTNYDRAKWQERFTVVSARLT